MTVVLEWDCDSLSSSLYLWWFVLIVIIDNADYYTHVKGYNMATSVESVANELISAVFTAHSFLETG